jgi:predicted acylesterase/phospholipase RssA
MARQLQESRAKVPAPPAAPSTLALLPLHSGLPLDEVARLLVEALGEHGPATELDDPGSEPKGAALLESCERENDHVVLVGSDAGLGGPWNRFCLRQADRVLALAAEGPVPEPVAADDRLHGCDLLFLLREPGTMAPWLDALAPRARYLLRPDDLEGSLGAAARRLVGGSVGLVLSGGGARAFGHIGVLQELEAAGVVIDRVAGVSMGAFVGGMFAAGMGAEEVDARCYEEWVRHNPLGDYRFPRHALIRGDRARAMLHRNLPGLIEELPRDFACTATDLHTGEEVVFRRGSLAEEVGASLCLPGIAPPQRLSRRLLVDGVLVNALPLHLLDHGEGPLIASDATTGHGHDDAGREGGDQASGRREQESPSIAETMFRTVFLGGVEATRAARRRADLLISPPSAGVGLLEWHQLDRVKDAGRRAAVEALESAPARIFA